jgi:hypothetical protein
MADAVIKVELTADEKFRNQVTATFKKYEEFIIYDMTNLTHKLLELPGLVSYYQNVFYDMQNKLDTYEYQRAQKWQEKYIYYKNDFDFSLTNTEIKQFIERDVEILELIRKIARVKLIANRAEDTIKSLREFSWTIKHLIEWQKFQAGIVN